MVYRQCGTEETNLFREEIKLKSTADYDVKDDEEEKMIVKSTQITSKNTLHTETNVYQKTTQRSVHYEAS